MIQSCRYCDRHKTRFHIRKAQQQDLQEAKCLIQYRTIRESRHKDLNLLEMNY